MIKFIDSNVEFSLLLKESMESYRFFDWSVAWMSQPDELYELLVKYKEKVRLIVTGLYGIDNKKHVTSENFVKEFKDLRDENNHYRVIFIKRRKRLAHFILHTKLYYFENSDSDWRLFIGSSNFTQLGLSESGNLESMILCDQDSFSNNEIKEYFTWIKSSFINKDMDFIPYRMKELEKYINVI